MVITIEAFLAVCAGISCVGLAITYLIKTAKFLYKPADTVNKKIEKHDELLSHDKARLDTLTHMMADMRECMVLLLESQIATLEHLEDGNHTKMLNEKKEKISKYLYEHVGGVQ